MAMNSERGSLSAAAASAMESRVWRRDVRTWLSMGEETERRRDEATKRRSDGVTE
jgi:hypothetical protein